MASVQLAHTARLGDAARHAVRRLLDDASEGSFNDVRRDRRRRGLASAVMAELEGVIRSAYELGALSASAAGAPLYTARGWERWRGRTWALTPVGRIRTPAEDDSAHVLPVSVRLELTGDLTCDWRDGDLW